MIEHTQIHSRSRQPILQSKCYSETEIDNPANKDRGSITSTGQKSIKLVDTTTKTVVLNIDVVMDSKEKSLGCKESDIVRRRRERSHRGEIMVQKEYKVGEVVSMEVVGKNVRKRR